MDLTNLACQLIEGEVPRDGIEPPPPAFSGRLGDFCVIFITQYVHRAKQSLGEGIREAMAIHHTATGPFQDSCVPPQAPRVASFRDTPCCGIRNFWLKPGASAAIERAGVVNEFHFLEQGRPCFQLRP